MFVQKRSALAQLFTMSCSLKWAETKLEFEKRFETYSVKIVDEKEMEREGEMGLLRR